MLRWHISSFNRFYVLVFQRKFEEDQDTVPELLLTVFSNSQGYIRSIRRNNFFLVKYLRDGFNLKS